MNPIVMARSRTTVRKPPKKEYSSPLREEQAEQTRLRVVEAATRLVARGASALTIPAVAREAGVAVPTVYRYFPSKEALEDGIAAHVRALIGVPKQDVAGGLDGWVRATAETWRRSASIDRSIYPVMLAAVGRDVFDPRGAKRRELVARSLAASLEGVEPAERRLFTDVVAALSSTTGAVSFLRTGLDIEEAVARYAWLVERLHGALRRSRK